MRNNDLRRRIRILSVIIMLVFFYLSIHQSATTSQWVLLFDESKKEDLPDENPGIGKFQPARTEDFLEYQKAQPLGVKGTLTPWENLDCDDKFTRNFNKYDSDFINIVAYWNNQLRLCMDNTQIIIVADFLKHMAMVESTMGYHSGFTDKETGKWIDTEDVMQVANPKDPAMKTMRGETKDEWRDGEGNLHEFQHNHTAHKFEGNTDKGVDKDLKVTCYNISGEESIFWGTRWFLYQLTKGTGEDSWRCNRKLTQEILLRAAEDYNGGGDPEYVCKMKKVLEKGKGVQSLETPEGRKVPHAPKPSDHWKSLVSSKVPQETGKPQGYDPPIYKNIMIFPTAEKSLGYDLNGDGDISDTILRYQNLKTGEVINTGLIASGVHHSMDIHENTIVFVGEGAHIYYYDINTGRARDTGAIGSHPSIYGTIIAFVSEKRIHYFDLSTQTLVDTKVIGNSPVIYEDIIAFWVLSPGLTIWIYDLHIGMPISTEMSGKNPTLYKNMIAFETLEVSIAEDLNGDGDTFDCVIRCYDLRTQAVINTGAVGRYPALHCDRIVFTTPEKAVNQDLNGDGNILSNVIRYYDLNTNEIVNTKKLGLEPDIYDNIITYYIWEHWATQDLNGDGDMNDYIVDTYQTNIIEMAIAGLEVALFLIFLLMGSIAVHFKSIW